MGGRVRGSVLATGSKAFAERQGAFRDVLADLVSTLEQDLYHEGSSRGAGEQLGCSLWVHLQSKGLIHWGSSERIWCDPRTLVPMPIAWSSDIVAVKAFCAGSVVALGTTEQTATRWNHVVGAPLYLRGARWGRLPVGSMTVASTLPERDSVLHRGQVTVERFLRRAAESLASLLDADGEDPAHVGDG